MNAARRTPIALVALALLALTLVGCGVKSADGGSNGSGDTPTTTTPTTEPSDETTETTEATTETTEDSPDTTDGSTDTTFPDVGDFGKDDLVKLYTDMGLSEDQANCLVDTIFDSAANGQIDPGDATDQSAIFDYLAKCEIDITDFGGTGGN